MPQAIYECLNCHIPFKPNSAQNGKFHNRDCYTNFRHTHTREEISALQPKPIAETNTSASTIDLDQSNGQTTDIKNIDQQNADTDVEEVEIEFEDLSLKEIKNIVTELYNHIQELSLELNELHNKIIDEDNNKLHSIVDNFIKEVRTVSYPVHVCAGCSKPLDTDKVFCNDSCAQTYMSSRTGVLRLENGKMIFGKKYKN